MLSLLALSLHVCPSHELGFSWFQFPNTSLTSEVVAAGCLLLGSANEGPKDAAYALRKITFWLGKNR